MTINATGKEKLYIGKVGENLANRVEFTDFYKMCESEFGAGAMTLVHERNDENPYPIALTFESGRVYWDIKNADLAVAGTGLCELIYIVGDVVKKSLRWKTVTLDALGETVDPPEAWQSYVDAVIAKVAEVENMTVNAETLEAGSAASVTKTEGEVINLKFGIPRGRDGDKGDDGYSPSAIVQRTDDGARVTIVDKNGVTTAEVKDGKDGDVTTIVDFELEDGVLYCETVAESILDFNMSNGVLEVNY